MKHLAVISPLLLAGALFASAACAQEQAAPAAATDAAAPATDAAAPAAEAAAPATDAAAAPVAPEAAAPAATATVTPEQFAKMQTSPGTPKDGKALVVFYRPAKFAGSAIKFKVREGEKELGQLSSGHWFVRNLEPGTHQFTVHSEAKDITNIELEAGETYYLSGSVSMGVFAGRPNLSPSNSGEFDVALKKMKRVDIGE